MMVANGNLVKNLIFDFDGTLFFTKKANYEAYSRAFFDVGILLTEEQYSGVYGLRSDGLFSAIAPMLSVDLVRHIRQQKTYYYRQLIPQIVPNIELIHWMKCMKHTHQIALVTTASKANVLPILEHFGLDNFFDVSVYGEDVAVGKPDPECYLICLDKIGAKPEECVVFEDSEVGIKAAQMAKLNVIKVVEYD